MSNNRYSEAEKKGLLERIARMSLMEVSNADIAKVIGVDPSRVSQFKNEPEYQEIYGSLLEEKVEENKDINDGLDAIEKLAISKVISTLMTSHNPDYALRALVVANKANRKGQTRGNVPINAESGKTVVIQLNQQFVQAVARTGLDIKPIAVNGEVKKHEQVLPPSTVEKILNLPKVKGVSDELVVDVARATGVINTDEHIAEPAFVDL